MAKPTNTIDKIKLPGESTPRLIIPHALWDGTTNYQTTLPILTKDEVVALMSDLKFYTTTASTANAFEVTIPHLTALEDGLAVYVRFHAATASGATLNVNGLGAKPIYYRTTTAITTHISANSYVILVYRASDSRWIMLFNYDANSNTIGYQIRTNSAL